METECSKEHLKIREEEVKEEKEEAEEAAEAAAAKIFVASRRRCGETENDAR